MLTIAFIGISQREENFRINLEHYLNDKFFQDDKLRVIIEKAIGLGIPLKDCISTVHGPDGESSKIRKMNDLIFKHTGFHL